MRAKTFAGFTIGPISPIINSAKKTRELWIGSYLFSFYMENLCNKLNYYNELKFILPFVHNGHKKIQAGTYPDKFIIESDTLTQDQLYKIIDAENNKVFAEFCNLITDELKKHEGNIINDDPEFIKDILNKFLQRKFAVLTQENPSTQKHSISKINNILSALEENLSIYPGKCINTCNRCEELPAVVWLKDQNENDGKRQKFCPLCFLKNKGNSIREIIKNVTDNKVLHIPSTARVADKELFEKLPSELQIKLRDEEVPPEIYKKHLNQELLQYNSYLAIIKADGDNVSKLIDKSEDIYKFTLKAEELTKDYGGQPIFLGGDDILTFIPVQYNGKTVFDYINDIKNNYCKIVDHKATISFGVNIIHNKFPLASALQKVTDLEKEAKSLKDKNGLALCLTKNSGKSIQLPFKLDSNLFYNFNQLLLFASKGKTKLLKGVVHNLERFKQLLCYAKTEKEINAFFANNFNEEIPIEFEEYINLIKEILINLTIKTSLPDINEIELQKTKKSIIENVFDMIRIINFLKGERHD